MKVHPLLLLLSVLFLSSAGRERAFGQGSLTPPGAPAPTMKALSEMEPRIAIQSLPGDATAQFLISNSGSYYLTANVTGLNTKSAIAVAASLVTIDLNGFTLSGLSSPLPAIEIRGVRQGVTVLNGILRGFDGGGVVAASPMTNGRFEGLQIFGTGASPGLNMASTSLNVLVRACAVYDANGIGISVGSNRGSVEFCAVNTVNSTASCTGISADNVVGCSVLNVITSGSGQATGIIGSKITNCTINNVVSTGGAVAVGAAGSAVEGCSVSAITSGSGQAFGISGQSIVNCHVGNVASTGANLAVGISSATAAACRVQSVNSSAGQTGQGIGISSALAQHCTVSSIGGAASAAVSPPTGISATTVLGCTVSLIGSSSSSTGAVGIVASGGTVADCTVGNVVAGTARAATGITADQAHRCNVNSVSLGAGSTSNCTGISAAVITHSHVTGISGGGGTGTLIGLSNYRLAQHCSVNGVTGGVLGSGCSTTQPGRSEALAINNASDFGIAATSSHAIVGCTVSGSIVGLSASGTRNLIDGNHLIGTSAGTGIQATAVGSGTLIVRNQVRGFTTRISAEASCQVGPIVNTGGTFAAATNGLSNFTD